MGGGAVEVNHAGLTVTDMDAALAWYSEVFGLEVVLAPVETSSEGRAGAIFGPGFGRMKRAVMRAPNGVGIELFEFVEPRSERRVDNFDYWRTGIFHLCLTCSDVARQLDAVVAAGGRARTEALPAGRGRSIAYCEDPFGNVLELTDKRFDDIY